MKENPEDSHSSDAETGAESRRDFLIRVTRGVAYSTPVIYTLAAPRAAVAQTSGPPMMMTICDYFPVLCDWLMMWGDEERQGPAPAGAPPSSFPSSNPPEVGLPSAPWDQPPPGGTGMM